MGKILAYFISANESSYKSLQTNSEKLQGVIPACLQIDKQGNLIANINERERTLFLSLKDNITITPMIQNYQLKSEVSNQFLINKDNWLRTVKQVLNFSERYNFKSINIDLEGVNGTNKDLYTEFISFLMKKISDIGIALSLSIPAKTENHNNSSWSAAYDYKKLGNIADEIIIMAYDYHWAGGPPGPIAPFFWVRDVIDYAIMKIPVHKLYLGIPCYGYDWIITGNNKKARGLSYSQIIKIKNEFDIKSEWDQDSKTPYMKYDNHEIWFENETSIMKKIELVGQYNLQGTAFWRLGLESPQIWKKL